MKRDPMTERLRELAEPVATAAGYELVDVQYRREQQGWVCRVFIDSPLGISFDDCERVSRELSAVFDVHDPVPQAYSLEVSSPGIDRPLTTVEHFQRFAGHEAKIALKSGLAGRRNFKGTIIGVQAGTPGPLVSLSVDGQRFELPIDDVETARLVPDWDAVLRGSERH